MDGLELQTTVDKVQPGRTVNIESGPQLPLGEGFILSQVRGGHSPVRKRYLDM